jgi:hypothetical protein
VPRTSSSPRRPPRAGRSQDPNRTPRRTRTIWASFLAASAAVSGLLLLADVGGPLPAAAGVEVLSTGGEVGASDATALRGRWDAIVIHHSGQPGGTPESIEREHLGHGFASLGYHFLIGNGAGLGDGAIFVGPRWNRQQPGAHVAPRALGAAPTADELNRRSIGICLVGNGNRHAFTPRQLRELAALVRRLQVELGIPASAIHLHSDLAAVESPGRLFPAAEFASALLP